MCSHGFMPMEVTDLTTCQSLKQVTYTIVGQTTENRYSTGRLTFCMARVKNAVHPLNQTLLCETNSATAYIHRLENQG